ncbi:ATP-binding cassette domain-containing protein [Thalassobaculum sp. OXR-137]|uniref:phosphonate ABC transporter ATP-binding protein n=1 Tax=Thalassobaculum sp. OXR-137 TaxID=3100173 RepID=UPI002AC919E4|nr:ATP-binding cassette domain-containing protein [Thalassobaculum sp. OXR-137]WPZ33664.1 ATP-binding cassette domain-containing protein [Thalassobaculum sp. OXR-137]
MTALLQPSPLHADPVAAAPAAAAPLIAAHAVCKRFADGPPVLDGVTLSIATGERVALLGANGAGKSTLLRALVGLIPITGGAVEILGQRFTELPSAKQRSVMRRRLGFVFQFHGLVGRTSALSNVVNGALGQGHGWRSWHQSLAPSSLRDAALEALDAVGLADRAAARADTLSGGQSQRVAIARAIVHGPDLLFADEPAASLDPAAGLDIMRLFARLAGEHRRTLVYTTHDMRHALEHADRIVALKAGQVVFDAAAGDLTERDLEPIYRG